MQDKHTVTQICSDATYFWIASTTRRSHICLNQAYFVNSIFCELHFFFQITNVRLTMDSHAIKYLT